MGWYYGKSWETIWLYRCLLGKPWENLGNKQMNKKKNKYLFCREVKSMMDGEKWSREHRDFGQWNVWTSWNVWMFKREMNGESLGNSPRFFHGENMGKLWIYWSRCATNWRYTGKSMILDVNILRRPSILGFSLKWGRHIVCGESCQTGCWATKLEWWSRWNGYEVWYM